MHRYKLYLIEEIFSSITHGVALLLTFLGIILFFLLHKRIENIEKIIGIIFFFLSLILTYGISTLFHSLSFTKAKKVFGILDHSSIFILIAGTYTPFLLSFKISAQSLFLIGLWLIAVAGITIKAIFFEKRKNMYLLLWLLLGWSIVFGIWLVPSISVLTLLLLFIGGLFYTCGIAFYLSKKIPFNHIIWHMFVVTGSTFHFLAVYSYV